MRITDRTLYRIMQILLVVAYLSIGHFSFQNLEYDSQTDVGNIFAIIFGLWAFISIGISIIIIFNIVENLLIFMGELSRGEVGININIPVWKQNRRDIEILYEELGRASINGDRVLEEEIFKKIQSLDN